MWISTHWPGWGLLVEHADVDLPLCTLDVDERDLARVAVDDPDDPTGDAQAHGQTLPEICRVSTSRATTSTATGTASATASLSPMPSSVVAGRQPTT